MLAANRRRRRQELYALGVAVNLAVGDPNHLQRELGKLIPDFEPGGGRSRHTNLIPWWNRASEAG